MKGKCRHFLPFCWGAALGSTSGVLLGLQNSLLALKGNLDLCRLGGGVCGGVSLPSWKSVSFPWQLGSGAGGAGLATLPHDSSFAGRL